MLHKGHVKTGVKRNFFTSRVITPWNNLSQDIVGTTSGTSLSIYLLIIQNPLSSVIWMWCDMHMVC